MFLQNMATPSIIARHSRAMRGLKDIEDDDGDLAPQAQHPAGIAIVAAFKGILTALPEQATYDELCAESLTSNGRLPYLPQEFTSTLLPAKSQDSLAKHDR